MVSKQILAPFCFNSNHPIRFSDGLCLTPCYPFSLLIINNPVNSHFPSTSFTLIEIVLTVLNCIKNIISLIILFYVNILYMALLLESVFKLFQCMYSCAAYVVGRTFGEFLQELIAIQVHLKCFQFLFHFLILFNVECKRSAVFYLFLY